MGYASLAEGDGLDPWRLKQRFSLLLMVSGIIMYNGNYLYNSFQE